MKQLAYILLIGLLPFYTTAQNHVPNCSFELHTTCPTKTGSISSCTGWRSLNNATPDYYHICAPQSNCKVPSNLLGYQYAARDSAYAGFICFVAGGVGLIDYREFITRDIIPLVPNAAYEVSLYVSLANKSKYASNNIDILFFDTISSNINWTTSGPNNYLNLQPQVTFADSGTVFDTTNWVRLSQIYVPDSAYANIAIGGFRPLNVIDTNMVNNSPFNYSYYYVDSVVVKPISKFLIGAYDTILCTNDSLLLDYTNLSKFTNNTFSVQLSDANGDFNNYTTIGTLYSDTSGSILCVIPNTIGSGANYRLRLISSSPADTVIDTLHTLEIWNLDSANIHLSSNSPLCNGTTLSFSNTATNSNISYSWTGPNSFSSTVGAPSIANATINNSGDYIATSTLYSCTQIDTLTVQVKPTPTKPTVTATTPVCQYDSLFLTVNSTTSGVTYGWTGPNYSVNDQNPVIANIPTSKSGLYTGFAILNGCVSSDTVTVQVKPSPDSVTVSSNSPLCTGDTLQLISDTSTGNVSYTWKGPNSFSANTITTSINNTTTNTTGWYSMTVDRNGCSYVDSTYVVVNQTPIQPTITYTNPICIGETLNLAASGSSNYSYQWYGPSSFSANAKNTTRSNVQTNYSGVYKVTTIENGCVSDTGFASITINPLPFAVITSNPTDSICVGQLASFTALPGNVGSSPQYNWYVNTQLVGSGISYNTTTLNNQDVVYCEMTDNTKCSVPYTDQSNFLTMTVLPWLAPSVTITVSPTGPVQSGTFLTFTATATNAGNNPQYQWKRNGKDIVGATGSSWGALSLNNNDTITVEIISDYRCPQPTNAVSNKIVAQIEGVGINEIAGLTNLTLVPNPNRGQFVLSGQLNHQGMVHISVMNMLGQTIYKTDSEVINNQLHQQIALPQVASGMYLLQLEVNGQQMNRKFKVE